LAFFSQLTFFSLFRQKKSDSYQKASVLYQDIVFAARTPLLYHSFHIPDTPLGRFESLSLHVILFLHHFKNTPLAQELVEIFFKDVDHCVRELGVSDAGVAKTMKKMSKMFYGRAASYHTALHDNNLDELGRALLRNIWPDDSELTYAVSLAAYAVKLSRHLGAQSDVYAQTSELSFVMSD
jgi:cytochrome b pre-mRNA-processing protein 3